MPRVDEYVDPRNDRVDAIIAMASYSDPLLRELLQAYKYEGVAEAGLALTDLFGAFLRSRMSVVDAMVPPDALVLPVPMHPLRERMRGFNQADLFAETFAAARGLSVDRGLLRRSFSRKRQAELEEDARVRNVDGAISVMDAVPASCVLVDDVVTTGSTLKACAAALRVAGAERVIAVTLLCG